MNRVITEPMKEALTGRYMRGDSSSALARDYGVSKECILTNLRRWGVEIKPRGTTERKEMCRQRQMAQAAYRHKIKIETLQEMISRSNGNCELCGDPLDHPFQIIDHCHRTGKVRGLVHGRCNQLLGMAGDSPIRLQQAIDYLKKFNANG